MLSTISCFLFVCWYLPSNEINRTGYVFPLMSHNRADPLYRSPMESGNMSSLERSQILAQKIFPSWQHFSLTFSVIEIDPTFKEKSDKCSYHN